jgi:hypothetical protein
MATFLMNCLFFIQIFNKMYLYYTLFCFFRDVMKCWNMFRQSFSLQRFVPDFFLELCFINK